MRKFYIDCTEGIPDQRQCAISEDVLELYAASKYPSWNVVKFDWKDCWDATYGFTPSEVCMTAIENAYVDGNVVFIECCTTDEIVEAFAKAIELHERDNYFGEWYEGVESVEVRHGTVNAIFLDEDYIKAISEKVGHRVAYKDGYFGLFTKQMFQKWRSEAETMYNELFE